MATAYQLQAVPIGNKANRPQVVSFSACLHGSKQLVEALSISFNSPDSNTSPSSDSNWMSTTPLNSHPTKPTAVTPWVSCGGDFEPLSCVPICQHPEFQQLIESFPAPLWNRSCLCFEQKNKSSRRGWQLSSAETRFLPVATIVPRWHFQIPQPQTLRMEGLRVFTHGKQSAPRDSLQVD